MFLSIDIEDTEMSAIMTSVVEVRTQFEDDQIDQQLLKQLYHEYNSEMGSLREPWSLNCQY